MIQIYRSTIRLIVIGTLCVSVATAQQVQTKVPGADQGGERSGAQPNSTSVADLSMQGILALRRGESESAIRTADALMRHHPEDPRALRLAADTYLRTGKVELAAKLFDRYLELRPSEMRGLWQRGIALYFVRDYKRAAKQFEEHRIVNPNDVENAAWHFLCVAKAESFEKAHELILPAPNDPRIPLEEIHQMLTTGNTDLVEQRISQTPADSNARSEAKFYGDFYLGLYADARGDKEKALQFLRRTAKAAPHHYMGDIARVYARHLSK